MKKTFKFYSIIWCALLILFIVIAFVPFGWVRQKYTPTFWLGCIFIVLSFVGQFICSYFALKEENIKKVFYNLSLITTSYFGLIVSFIFGCLCMLIPIIPYWIAIILCSLACVFNVITLTKSRTAISYVSNIDEKIKVQTFFVKSLTVDAESLMSCAKSEYVKAECKKVYEAVRYSDPMSSDALASMESEIIIKFGKLSDAVMNEKNELIVDIVEEIVALIGARNKKCKILK